MSLDVYLRSKPRKLDCTCECGHKHKKTVSDELYWANITHNLTKMADKAGVYYALWRPDEKGYTKAKHIISILEKGLEKLKANPDKYRKFNSSNGWGMYEHFVPFVEEYLAACKANPDARIEVSR